MTDKYKTLCPDCDGEMVSRTGQYGVFWGCKAYPKCKGTRDSMGRSKADREEYKRTINKDNQDRDELNELIKKVDEHENKGFTFNKTRRN